MATQDVFHTIRNTLHNVGDFLAPPEWLVHEIQNRILLLLNHVLQSEPEAMRRLKTQQGKTVYLSWRSIHLQVRITAAGLLELDTEISTNDLLLEVVERSPAELAKTVIQGNKPLIRIAGDVHLASELNWVIDHVRWDAAEDLSKIVGDVPAHKITQFAQAAANALRSFAQTALNTFESFKPQSDFNSNTDTAQTAPASTQPTSHAPSQVNDKSHASSEHSH